MWVMNTDQSCQWYSLRKYYNVRETITGAAFDRCVPIIVCSPRWLRNHFCSCKTEWRGASILEGFTCAALHGNYSGTLNEPDWILKTWFAHNAVAIEIVCRRRIARADMINAWETFLRTDAALGRQVGTF